MTTPKRYLRKSTKELVEAMGPLTRENGKEIARWCEGTWWSDSGEVTFYLNGWMMGALLDDWVIREKSDGSFQGRSPHHFYMYYEPVEASDE